MINEVVAVIGGNYGDEGKGWTTYNVARGFLLKNDTVAPDVSIINVLHNGGPQRGHTVKTNTESHVWHCFGSASSLAYHSSRVQVVTYYDHLFLFNPVAIMNELDLVEQDLGPLTTPLRLVINPLCFVTLPPDVLINRALERKRIREGCPHGSCGMGIWETQQRNMRGYYITISDLVSAKGWEQFEQETRSYYQRILEEYSLSEREVYYDEAGNRIPCWKDFWLAWKSLLKDPRIKFSIQKLNSEKKINKLTGEERPTMILLECGQGLCISASSWEDMEKYTTPSDTGMRGVMNVLNSIEMNDNTRPISFRALYCTRPYTTRHGAGPFEEDEEITATFRPLEETNKPNEFQGEMRFGRLDFKEFIQRTYADFSSNTRVGLGFFTLPQYCVVVNFTDTAPKLTKEIVEQARALGAKTYYTKSDDFDLFEVKSCSPYLK